MRAIYGKNFKEIAQKHLFGDFSAWAVNTSFVLVDDVTGHDNRELYDTLKTMSTRKELEVNIKFVPQYFIRDCMNFLFTSNRPDAFYLEDKDRRFFIHHATAEPLSDEFYRSYIKALELDLINDGREHECRMEFASAVYDYLLRVDLTGFNPGAPARMTQAKQTMIENVKSDLGLWVSQLRDNPEEVLRTGKARIEGDLFTSTEILNIYRAQTSDMKSSGRMMGVELVMAGIPAFKNKQVLQTSKGRQKYYIVRNTAKWAKATTAAAVAHIDNLYKLGGR
jgi:hypothetical protein